MSILQYLSRYAEPECACLPPQDLCYSHVVVIPAHDESPTMLEGFFPACAPQYKPLWIVVVNCSEDRTADEIARTRYLWRALTAGGNSLSDAPQIVLNQSIVGDILVVDRCSESSMLPAGQGVGLARKIGCDIALSWIERAAIESPWIHCTDADVTLPPSYFSASDALIANTSITGLSYPFRHQIEAASVTGRALQLYEMSLRYYVAGLIWAGSPYAFHCIGSTMAIRASAYHQVRGIPKRLAGEDFYLLNKLAKVGQVQTPDSDDIVIAQRTSNRTPFGTGPATAQITASLLAGENFTVYAPTTFALLREWLDTLNAFAQNCNLDVLQQFSHSDLLAALPANTEQQLRDASVQCKSVSARKRRLNVWFDGFRTLKFIHALRDLGHHNRPWAEAFDAAPFACDFQAS